ncbi:MAG: hypothetical protein DRP78_06395, partial [Candidatus Omnitrophota bacterium]
KALELQLEEGGLLGQILVKLQYVSQEQLDANINEQENSFQKLENVLVDIGIISYEQLNNALTLQKRDGEIFVKVVIDLGFLSEEELVSTIVTQYGFPYLELENYETDPEIIKLVPENIARKYALIPVDRIGNILTLSMADPLNNVIKEKITEFTGLKVETFISTFSDINNAIANYYA